MELFTEREVDVINPETEMHYAMRTSFQGTLFPHSHDFFEIFLLVEGVQSLEVNGHSLTLKPGALMLLRPGDVHTRAYLENGYHINVAFSAKIAQAAFDYLGSGYPAEKLMSSSYPPYTVLSRSESSRVNRQLQELNAVLRHDMARQRMRLRTLILDIFVTYLMRSINEQATGEDWFDTLLYEMEKTKNLVAGLPALLEMSGKSHEYLCRLFRQKLQCTPTEYVNELRLNYAANYLTHSDLEVIDVCYSSGFNDVSHFYHLFKKKYGVTPRRFRQQESHCTYLK